MGGKAEEQTHFLPLMQLAYFIRQRLCGSEEHRSGAIRDIEELKGVRVRIK
jgi:hypothetical protein